MDFVSLIPVLLPIALFVVSMIVVFTLRASDKSSRSLSTVKKLLDKYKSDVESSDNSFKQYAAELEQTVAKKDAEVKTLIQTVNSQLGELRSYSEDLARLKMAMETYKEALEGLARLTTDADDKIAMVQNDVDRLEKVRNVIDGFRQDMRDADDHLRKHEQRVIQLERESIGRMNTAVSETDSSMDEAMEGLHKESMQIFEAFKDKTDKDTELRLRKIDDAFKSVIHTVQEFFGELEAKLDIARKQESSLSSLMSQANALIKSSSVSSPSQEDLSSSQASMASEIEISSNIEPCVHNYVEHESLDDNGSNDVSNDIPSDVFDDDLGDENIDLKDSLEDTQEDLPSQWETYGEEEVVEFDDEDDK